MFNVGDRVRVCGDMLDSRMIGHTGAVVRVDDAGAYPVHVKIDNSPYDVREFGFAVVELEHIRKGE